MHLVLRSSPTYSYTEPGPTAAPVANHSKRTVDVIGVGEKLGHAEDIIDGDFKRLGGSRENVRNVDPGEVKYHIVDIGAALIPLVTLEEDDKG